MGLVPAQRITLIKEIAKRLANEEWHLIDLTLQQFDLPTANQWNGTRGEYVIAMTSEAVDETLVELGKYLGYILPPQPALAAIPVVLETQPAANNPADLPTFWSPGHFRLFIGHLAAFKHDAANLRVILEEQYSISGFVAHDDIEPNALWQAEIEKALGTCGALLAMMHPTFHDSKWTVACPRFPGHGLKLI
jgi:hypothetical protein